MYDKFDRKIDYLRVSVTDRCNLRCRYCMPPEGIKILPQKEILNFDEITGVVRSAVDKGIRKVRITGGEPLVRRDIVTLVKMISAIPGIRDLGMTTNGVLLGRFAPGLAEAGLMRVNVSLDTVDPKKFSEMTRGGDLADVFRGIKAAVDNGLVPVKLNCVVKGSSKDTDAEGVARFARENGLEVRFIHQMNLESGEFSIVEGGEGGDCKICNRLRLTANGMIMPCLFSDVQFPVRELGADEAIRHAVEHKPRCGSLNSQNSFYNIGG